VEFVAAHHRQVAPLPHTDTSALRLRITDRHTHEVTGYPPLSVSTDRIGVVALRCGQLLARLSHHGFGRDGAAGAPPRRDGSDGIFEVYPAGALRCWDLPGRGYKRGDNAAEVRATIIDVLGECIELGGTDHLDRLSASHDDLDAVVAALATLAAVTGAVQSPPSAHQAVAEVEGWIHLPTGTLRHLGIGSTYER